MSPRSPARREDRPRRGDTRYDTSLKVRQPVSAASDTVIVTTGTNYADALSISPYAFATEAPWCSLTLRASSSALKGIRRRLQKASPLSSAGTLRRPRIGDTSQLKASGVGSITRLRRYPL